MRKCIIYARVSTSEGQETDNQIFQLKVYAESQEWEVIDVITDTASGGLDSKERQGLNRVFKLAHQKKFDTLLFWSLDRLSREGSRKTISYLQELETKKIDWHSFTEPYISSLGIFSDAIISLLAALAKQERIRIAERTRAGMQRAKKNGAKFGRPKTDPKLMEQAYRLKSSGLSYARVAKEMGIGSSRAHQLVKSYLESNPET
jgi:putative DNA-invertase from lambdoid prophage Rac